MRCCLGDFELESSCLALKARIASWDRDVFGFQVVQVSELKVFDADGAAQDYQGFQEWMNLVHCKVAYARLPHQSLAESIFLESKGYRFIEMVLHPVLENLQALSIPKDHLSIEVACERDLPEIERIAASAFGNERYHVDPRLDPKLADLRYARWVRNSFSDPVQRLFRIRDGDRLLAFFIVESRADGSAYWHLTAVAPEWQGKGYGWRIWQAMLRHHQDEGCVRLTTTISARNVAVLNLYSKLGFGFLPPEMTFHWVRKEV